MTAATAAGKATLRGISSLGFSGAGFLTCYHLGVAQCLLKQGVLLKQGERPSNNHATPRLTGVSGGALTSAALVAGVDPDDGMQVILKVTNQTRQGTLDALTPG